MIARLIFRWVAVLIVSSVPLLFSSCNGDLGRYPVKGEVRFDGGPVDKGAIVFRPVGSNAVKTGERIVDGRYEIPAEKGPPLGKHKVLLYWEKKTGKTFADRETGEVFDKRAEGLPKEYQ